MTKQQIVDYVSDATGLTKVETETVMNGVMGTIIDSLANNEKNVLIIIDCLRSDQWKTMANSLYSDFQIKTLKDSLDDKEEQLNVLSTFVRLGILIWSGGILTLAYITLPPALGIPEQKLDPTFIASVFTGVLATFGVQAASKK